MGNINNQSSQSQLPINFKEISRSQHGILGDVKHIQNNHDQSQYALIERVFVSQIEFEKCLKKIKNRSKLGKMKNKYQPNNFIIEVIDYRSVEQSQFCGKTFKLFIFLKNFESDLKTVFQRRQSINIEYSEAQILQLMVKIVNCLIEMYDHSLKPFHLSMQSILLRKNTIKLIDCDLTSQMSPIDSLNFKSQLKKGSFIAPQMLAECYQYQSNSSKSDIFTLGMIVLSLINLRSVDEVYDYNLRRINFNLVESLIEKSYCSQGFKNVLREMLEEYPDLRVGILRLKQSLISIVQGCNNKKTIVNNNKLQQSEYKSSRTSKGVIYLGKQPLLQQIRKPLQRSYNEFQLQLHGNQRRKSYHKLLNDRSMNNNRQKKSVSVISQNNNHHSNHNNTENSSFLKQQYKQKPLLTIGYNNTQTLKTFVQVTPNIEKLRQHQNVTHDVSDIRSDTPISPSTLEIKDIYTNRNSSIMPKQPFVYNQQNNHYSQNYQQSKQYSTLNYKIPLFANQNMQINNINNQHSHQPQINQNFTTWMEKQQNKLKSYQNNQSNSISLQQKFKIPTFSKFNSFDKLQTPKLTSIDKLQTPRITKKFQFNNDSKNKRLSSGQKIKQNETPIKSLELIRTQKRQENSHLIKPIQKIYQQKVFGRYDFSNGSVYEGQFNTDNEFQGNGILYFSNGKIFYSGCWKSNQFHGFGILNNIQNMKPQSVRQVQINYHNFNLNDNNLWTQYEGEFCEDKKHGFGTLYFINGDKFSGCFFNDSIQGFGNFYRSKDHQTLMGIWMDNLFKQS